MELIRFPLLVSNAQHLKELECFIISHLLQRSKSKWLDKYISIDWLINEFIRKVKKHLKRLENVIKTVLVSDNTLVYPDELECKGNM